MDSHKTISENFSKLHLKPPRLKAARKRLGPKNAGNLVFCTSTCADGMSRYAFTWWGNVDKISIHQFGWRCFVGDLIVHTCLHPIKGLLLRRTCVYRMEFLLCRNDAAAAFPRRMRHLHSWWYAEGAFAWRFLAGRALLCPGVTGCGLVPAVASWR